MARADQHLKGSGKSTVGSWIVLLNPIGSMYAIYSNIYHQYTPNVSIYTSTMDPMGNWLDFSASFRIEF